jgi:hypothetical protein
MRALLCQSAWRTLFWSTCYRNTSNHLSLIIFYEDKYSEACKSALKMYSLTEGLLISLNHRHNEKSKSYPMSWKLSIGGVVKRWKLNYSEQTHDSITLINANPSWISRELNQGSYDEKPRQQYTRSRLLTLHHQN